MTISSRPLRIGITTTHAMVEGEAVWNSGMGQNALYLALLLRRLAFTDPVFVVPDVPLSSTIDGVRTMSAIEGVAQLDMIIELGVRLDSDLMGKFRGSGGKLISYVAGNAMVMNFEAVANNREIGEVPSPVGFDAVWLTPQHMATNASYVSLTRSDNVFEVPHIWHPSCLWRAIDTFGANEFFWKERQSDAPWRIGIFDPTINVVKTFHLPLLVCEEAERVDQGLIRNVLLFAAKRFIGNQHFAELVAALDLGRKGKVFAEDRHALPNVLGAHVDAVVTHQWQNNLNYLYWDVLYSGRPLVHNVPDLADAGYCYKDFDPADGGRVLADALASHGRDRDKRRSGELEVLWTYSIDNPAVQHAYSSLILQAMENT